METVAFRQRERPKMKREDNVKQNLKVFKIYHQKNQAKSRNEWKQITEQAKRKNSQILLCDCVTILFCLIFSHHISEARALPSTASSFQALNRQISDQLYLTNRQYATFYKQISTYFLKATRATVLKGLWCAEFLVSQ